MCALPEQINKLSKRDISLLPIIYQACIKVKIAIENAPYSQHLFSQNRISQISGYVKLLSAVSFLIC